MALPFAARTYNHDAAEVFWPGYEQVLVEKHCNFSLKYVKDPSFVCARSTRGPPIFLSSASATCYCAREGSGYCSRHSSDCWATTMDPGCHLRRNSLRRQIHAAHPVQRPSRVLVTCTSKPFRLHMQRTPDTINAGFIETPNTGLLTIDQFGNTDRHANTFRRERHSTSASHEAYHCARRGSGLGNLRSRPVSFDTPVWSRLACLS